MSLIMLILGVLLTGTCARVMWGNTAGWFACGIIFFVYGMCEEFNKKS